MGATETETLTAEMITAAVAAGVQQGGRNLAREIYRDLLRGAPEIVEDADLKLLYDLERLRSGARSNLATAFVDAMSIRVSKDPELKARYNQLQRR